ncbi:hypothetical protein H257_04096 [Aphanomyces astaci]|uniref:Uncharacterized protein n=1 Tax=Aphanomyces astaci TaxID=112090 RepID=W4GUC9_APHAT|nr:hypothetical protein H257_04096 [Aphanomyces astaci]ETV83345.1 hypothetical protein H257_04096 [Aphanomyces astaci]|eukprot:XP_009826775.1 hypothetical protein H257_04096 [Aphanomyces astaci]
MARRGPRLPQLPPCKHTPNALTGADEDEIASIEAFTSSMEDNYFNAMVERSNTNAQDACPSESTDASNHDDDGIAPSGDQATTLKNMTPMKSMQTRRPTAQATTILLETFQTKLAHAFSIQLMEHTIAFRSKGVVYQTIFDVFLGNISTNIKDVAYHQFIDASRQFAAVPYLLRRGEIVVKADEPFPKPVCPACAGDGTTSASPIIATTDGFASATKLSARQGGAGDYGSYGWPGGVFMEPIPDNGSAKRKATTMSGCSSQLQAGKVLKELLQNDMNMIRAMSERTADYPVALD